MTAVQHMLDTDTASYIIKRRSAAIEARLAAIPPDRVCISVVTRAELMFGLQRLAPAHLLRLGVRQFLKAIRTLPWDIEAADYYAGVRHQLGSANKLIGELDMMIAAHAMAIGAVLVTNNTRHFARIAAPLALDNWVAV